MNILEKKFYVLIRSATLSYFMRGARRPISCRDCYYVGYGSLPVHVALRTNWHAPFVLRKGFFCHNKFGVVKSCYCVLATLMSVFHALIMGANFARDNIFES